MSFIKPQAKEINCKIVYYGPPFSGKSTTLSAIYEKTAPGHRGKLVSLTEGTDRTLFFDFLPLSLGKMGEYTIRLHLYTVPGQAVHENSRKIILKGVDGVVFVADSQVERLEENLASWQELEKNLREQEEFLSKIPLAVQYNKRDVKHAAPVPELQKLFNGRAAPEFETVATKGSGVMETLQAVARQVLLSLNKA